MMSTLYVFVSIVLFLKCTFAEQVIPQTLNVQAKCHANTYQDIYFPAHLKIPPDGGELTLPIIVSPVSVQIDGTSGRPRVARVSSEHQDSVVQVGMGEEIDIYVDFYTPEPLVVTSDTSGVWPTLELQTGCSDDVLDSDYCPTISEVQELKCAADGGYFALTFFDKQTISNIAFDISAHDLRLRLETELTSVKRVDVEYLASTERACTSEGNVIILTFLQVNTDGLDYPLDGNWPETLASASNLGGMRDSGLTHMSGSATLTPTALELVRGRQFLNQVAVFVDLANDGQRLRFRYTVGAGDLSSDLDYVSAAALVGGSISLTNSNSVVAVDRTLPRPGSPLSLAGQSNIRVDGVSIPDIVTVSSSLENGVYGLGQVIPIEISFSHDVVVSGVPTCVVETGAFDGIGSYVETVGARTLVFHYTVSAGHSSSDLDVSHVLVVEGQSSVRRASSSPTMDVSLNVPEPAQVGSLSYHKDLVIDVQAPVISRLGLVHDNDWSPYVPGDGVTLSVATSAPVTVTCNSPEAVPRLKLQTDIVNLYPGQYIIKTLGNVLTFPPGHGLTTALSQGLIVRIGTQDMTVVSVENDDVTMTEAYLGTAVVFQNLVSTPQIEISTPGFRYAALIELDTAVNTETLKFQYHVQLGDTSSALDVVDASSLDLRGCTIKRSSTNPTTNLILDLPVGSGSPNSLLSTTNLVISSVAPQVISVDIPALEDGVYRQGQVLSIVVSFDMTIQVSGIPSLKLDLGPTSGWALFTGMIDDGDDSKALVFQYTVKSSDKTTPGSLNVEGVGALKPFYGGNHATIVRKSKSESETQEPYLRADLTLPVDHALTGRAIVLNSDTAPYVTDCDLTTVTTGTNFGVGEVLDIELVFSLAVDVTGEPKVTFPGLSRAASYVSGSGSTSLGFRLEIQAGDETSQLRVDGLLVNGGSMVSSSDSSIPVVLIFPSTYALSERHLSVTSVSPVVTRVFNQEPSTREYLLGDRIPIWIEFDQPIQVVSGEPRLELNLDDGAPVFATYEGVHDQMLYFSTTPTADSRCSSLEVAHDHALSCRGEPGLNVDPSESLHSRPVLAEFQNQLYLTWIESKGSGKQVRAKVYRPELNDEAARSVPEWISLDTSDSGLNLNSNQEALESTLVTSASTLYCIWTERAPTSQKTQIRIAAYRSSWTNLAVESESGLNFDPAKDAQDVSAVALGDTLVLAWTESPTESSRIRVVTYDEGALPHTFIDGETHLVGTSKPSLALYESSSEVLALAYLREARVHVSLYTSSNVLSPWASIDGHPDDGLNVADTSSTRPALFWSTVASTLYLAWIEDNHVFVKAFNGDLVSPSWTLLTRAEGLSAGNVVGSDIELIGVGNDLVVVWTEAKADSVISELYVARVDISSDPISLSIIDSWRVDTPATGLNYDPRYSASHVSALSVDDLPESDNLLMFLTWQEMDSNSKAQLRVSKWQSHDRPHFTSLSRQQCIQRQISAVTESTVAQLRLPPPASVFSLSGEKTLYFDTTVSLANPSVSLLLPHEYSYWKNGSESPLNFQPSTRVQTLDIVADSTINQGSFRLRYNDLLVTSTCLDWNADAETVKSAVESMSSLLVLDSVTKDTTFTTYGHRYIFSFTTPEFGLLPLELELDPTCTAFTCTSDDTGVCVTFQWNDGLPPSTFQPGVVDVQILFKHEVSTTSPPALDLTLARNSEDDVDIPYRPYQIQTIDVGQHLPSPVQSGEIVLTYNGIPSACIDILSPAMARENPSSMVQALLNSSPELRAIGILDIETSVRGNGRRFVLRFGPGIATHELGFGDSGACAPVKSRVHALDVYATAGALSAGSFTIQSNLGLVSSCVEYDISSNHLEQRLKSELNLPSVKVTKDPFYFTYGTRYYLDNAHAELSIDLNNDDCSDLACDSESTCTSAHVAFTTDFGQLSINTMLTKLLFRYTVTLDDVMSPLALSSDQALSGMLTRGSSSVDTSSDVTLSSTDMIEVTVNDPSTSNRPKITSITSSTSVGGTTYGDGDVVVIQVTFDQDVQVVQTSTAHVPELWLNPGTGAKAVYVSGSNSPVLSFAYEVQAGHSTNQLDTFSSTALRLGLSTATGARITSTSLTGKTLDADLSIPTSVTSKTLGGSKNLIIDTRAPTLVSISSFHPDNVLQGYGVGEEIELVVTVSTDVVVAGGTPTLGLDTGRVATYRPLDGSIQWIQVDPAVTDGQFQLIYGSAVTPCFEFDATADSLQSALSGLEDLVSVTKTDLTKGNHVYRIQFESRTSDLQALQVVVNSGVCLPLVMTNPDSANKDRSLIYATNRDTLLFLYVVQELDMTSDLNVITFDLNGATIRRVADQPRTDLDLDLALCPSLADVRNIKIDTTRPSVSSISVSSSSDTYGVFYPTTSSPSSVLPGQISFTLNLNFDVHVSMKDGDFLGRPYIELNTKTMDASSGLVRAPARAYYQSQTSTATALHFIYIVESQDESEALDFVDSSSAFHLPTGTTITRASTRNTFDLDTTLPFPGLKATKTLVIAPSTCAPTVSYVRSNHSSGTFGPGEVIDIQVGFSRQTKLAHGLNARLDINAKSPSVLVHHVGPEEEWIFFAWLEEEELSTATLHIAMYDWTQERLWRLDPSSSNLNVNAAVAATDPTLAVFQNQVYLSWCEGPWVYVAQYNGDPSSPTWTRGASSGLNLSLKPTLVTARDPQLIGYLGRLYCIFRGIELESVKSAIYVYVDKDDGGWSNIPQDKISTSISSPSTSRDSIHVTSPSVSVYRGQLYVCWTELNSTSGLSQLQLKRYSTLHPNVWQTVDVSSFGGQLYRQPQLVNIAPGTIQAQLVIVWSESSSLYVSKWNIDHTVWTSKLVVEHASSLNTRIDLQAVNATHCALTWLESSSKHLGIGLLNVGHGNPSNWTFDRILDHHKTAQVYQATRVAVFARPGALVHVTIQYDGHSRKIFVSTSEDLSHWTRLPIQVPRLTLNTGGVATCTDASGVEATEFNFQYVVSESSASGVLDLTALELNGGSFLDALVTSTPAILITSAGTASDDPRRLSASGVSIVIETDVPVISHLSSNHPVAGMYGAGQVLDLQVYFTQPVVIVGPDLPQLHMQDHDITRKDVATYSSGNNTNALTFQYTIQQGVTRTGVLQVLARACLDFVESTGSGSSGSGSSSSSSSLQRASSRPSIVANLECPNPGSTNSLSANVEFKVDFYPPQIIQVDSTTANGVYYPGDSIEIRVHFTKPVMILGSAVPALVLNTRGTTSSPQSAMYDSGNATSILTFVYQVQEGDTTSDLAVYDDRDLPTNPHNLQFVNAIRFVNVGSTSDDDDTRSGAGIFELATIATTYAQLLVPAPGTVPGSLSSHSDLQLDSNVPRVTRVTSNDPDGFYGVADVLSFVLTFSQPVVVTGTPELVLDCANPTLEQQGYPRHNRLGIALYMSGSGSTDLLFQYTVKAADSTKGHTPAHEYLDYVNEDALRLDDGLSKHRTSLGDTLNEFQATIKRQSSSPTLNANLKLPTPYQTSAPAVNGSFSIYSSGSRIRIRTDGMRIKSISSVDMSEGECTPLLNGDFEGYSCHVGQVIDIDVTFSHEIKLEISDSGSPPTLDLNTGSGLAEYTSMVHDKCLRFRYTVASSDIEVDGLEVTGFHLGSGATLVDRAQLSPFSLDVPDSGESGSLSVSPSAKIKIQSTSAPTVLEIRGAKVVVSETGTTTNIGVSETLEIRVQFSSRVKLDDPTNSPPSLNLNTGQSAAYVSGDTTTTLVFYYTVQDEDKEVVLLDVLSLSGSLKALSTTPTTTVVVADLPEVGSLHSLALTSQLSVNFQPPSIVALASLSPNGTYKSGDVIFLTVEYSEAVNVSAPTTPNNNNEGLTLDLNVCPVGNSCAASYVGGSNSRKLIFKYTFQLGDASARLDVRASSLSLGAGWTIIRAALILDPLENPQLALTSLDSIASSRRTLGQSSRIRIIPSTDDSSVPTITGVSTTAAANAVFGTGHEIDLVVHFSSPVQVIQETLQVEETGSFPRLRLSVYPGTYATYVSNSAAFSSLTFRYTVNPEHQAFPLEVDGVFALENGLTWKIVSSTTPLIPATLTLPNPFSSSSLSLYNIQVDGSRPRVIRIWTSVDHGTYGAGAELDIYVSFSSPVVVAGSPALRMNTGHDAVYFGMFDSTTIIFRYVVQSGDQTYHLDYQRLCRDYSRPLAWGYSSGSRETSEDDSCLKPTTEFVSALYLKETGSAIQRLSTSPTTDADLRLPEPRAWPYIRQTSADVYSSDYTSAGSPDIDSGVAPSVSQSLMSPQVELVMKDQLMLWYSNGIPDHDWTPAMISNNKNPKRPPHYSWEINRHATVSLERPVNIRPGNVFGLALNGIPFVVLDHLESSSEDIDACGGKTDEASGAYEYLASPVCLIQSLRLLDDDSDSTPLTIGFALDGYRIVYYSNTSTHGYDSSQEDECHGRLGDHHSVLDYHYAVVQNRPMNISCLYGAFPAHKAFEHLASNITVSGFRGMMTMYDDHRFMSSTLTKIFKSVSSRQQQRLYPWINANEVDIVYTTSSRLVYSTCMPSVSGVYPNVYTPRSIQSQHLVLPLPLNPIAAPSPISLTSSTSQVHTSDSINGDILGIFLNGIPFKSAIDRDGVDIVATGQVVLDRCNGHVDTAGTYHYLKMPVCLLETFHVRSSDETQPIILGYALDGYPIFYVGSGDVPLGLDACHGKTMDDEGGQYGYYMTEDPPYILGCFHGQIDLAFDPRSSSSSSEIMPQYLQSLSRAHVLQLDTTSPHVEHVYRIGGSTPTTNHPITYVAGETLDVGVAFNVPVVVIPNPDTESVPRLRLNFGTAYATYVEHVRANVLKFQYLVTSADESTEVNYASSEALELNGAQILEHSGRLTVADATLVAPNTSTSFGFKETQVQSLKVRLRGLVHEDVSDVHVSLHHADRHASVFSDVTNDSSTTPRTFGAPDVRIFSSATSVSGTGFDYTFEDQMKRDDVNLALREAVATQSSTYLDAEAHRAIDGNRNGYFSSASVTHTDPYRALSADRLTKEHLNHSSAWWQLKLVDPKTVMRTIVIWNREQDQVHRYEVQELMLKIIDPVTVSSLGFWFRLTCHSRVRPLGQDLDDGEDSSFTTESIPSTASASELQRYLEALSNVGTLRVSKTSETTEIQKWKITFLTEAGNLPLLSVDSTGVLRSSPTDDSPASLTITTLVDGSENDWTNYNQAQVQISGRLFPCWVMVFDEHASMAYDDLESAQSASIFKIRLTRVQRQSTIVLPRTVHAQYVRLQLEDPTQVLSVAEVEVYAQAQANLHDLTTGSPIPASSRVWASASSSPLKESARGSNTHYPPTTTSVSNNAHAHSLNIYAPDESFVEAFGACDGTGPWNLQLRDVVSQSSSKYDDTTSETRGRHGVGAVSDYVLELTNVAGITREYYMDISASVTTVPRFGDLYVPWRHLERDHVDGDGNGVLDRAEVRVYLETYHPAFRLWDSFRQGEAMDELLAEAVEYQGVPLFTTQHRAKAPCLADRTCQASFGTSAFVDDFRGNDVPMSNLIGHERYVRYVPRRDYVGPDTFTYTLHLGNAEAEVDGQVNVDVMLCAADGGPCRS